MKRGEGLSAKEWSAEVRKKKKPRRVRTFYIRTNFNMQKKISEKKNKCCDTVRKRC